MRLHLTVLLTLCAARLSAAPVITWVSDPVGPNETVVLLTEGCSAETVIEAARLRDGAPGTPDAGRAPQVEDWTRIEPLQAARQCVKAVIPADWRPGVYALRVREGGEVSAVTLANAPDPWWVQGDEGQRSTPGGWVRAFGKNLGPGDNVRAVLRSAAGEDTTLEVRKVSCWSLEALVPPATAPGDCTLLVHNGLGGGAAWREAGRLAVIPPVAWKTDVFTVPEKGEGPAVDAAIRETLEKAKENGGGIVLLPRGTYDVEGQLTIPPGTVLRGEGMGLVSLYWKNTAEPPESLITGTDYGLEDFSLYCHNYRRVVSDTRDSERFRMERVRLRAVPEACRPHNIKQTNEVFAALHLQGRNFRVVGCDIYGAVAGNAQGRAIVTGPWGFAGDKGPWYGVMTDNEIYGHMYGCENLKGLIFERNAVTGVCVSCTTYWNNFAMDLYCADNAIRHVYGGDREIMTFDAGGGAYFGKVAQADGTRLTLAADPEFRDYAPTAHTDYRGAAVYILDGMGAGQYRLVTANQGREWEVDRPWLAPPDKTSVISISPFRGRNLFVNNTFTDGGAMQLYGAAADVIVADNKGARIDGFFTWGLNPHGWGWQPAWTCQFLDNELTEGSGFGGRIWGPAFFGVTTSNNDETYAGPLARANILRRNVLQTQGYIRVEGNSTDTLVEDCVVKHSPVGIRVGKDTQRTVLRRNHFEAVGKPLEGEGVTGATVVE